MTWKVQVTKRAVKLAAQLPVEVFRHLEALIDDLEVGGPVRGDWPNYSKLSGDRHHCHLSYAYVAVWTVVDRQVKILEVVYVGSRKDAPY